MSRLSFHKVNEWQATLYLFFIDFEKAFDSIHWESLWSILQFYGIPPKIIRMIKIFYDDFKCTVTVDWGERSNWFDIKTGVKQGCNMPGSVLFLIAMDWVMIEENSKQWKTRDKMEINPKTWRPGLCRWCITYVLH